MAILIGSLDVALSLLVGPAVVNSIIILGAREVKSILECILVLRLYRKAPALP